MSLVGNRGKNRAEKLAEDAQEQSHFGAGPPASRRFYRGVRAFIVRRGCRPQTSFLWTTMCLFGINQARNLSAPTTVNPFE